MVKQMPTQREILKWNRKLPDNLRQCSVVLQFKKEMPKYLTENFYLVRMTQGMLNAGEDDMWIPEITQSQLFDKQKCLGCGRIMKRVGSLSTVCLNHRICNCAGRVVIQTLKRAVHSIKTEFKVFDKSTGKLITVSFLAGRGWKSVNTEVWWNMGYAELQKQGLAHGVVSDDDIDLLRDAIRTYLKWPEGKIPMDMVSGCLVILDRRYSETSLCAVWRTCGMLCDKLGWSLK